MGAFSWLRVLRFEEMGPQTALGLGDRRDVKRFEVWGVRALEMLEAYGIGQGHCDLKPTAVSIYGFLFCLLKFPLLQLPKSQRGCSDPSPICIICQAQPGAPGLADVAERRRSTKSCSSFVNLVGCAVGLHGKSWGRV